VTARVYYDSIPSENWILSAFLRQNLSSVTDC
jgi:hypothetical protein